MVLIKTRAAVTSGQNEIRTAGPPSERPSSGKVVDFGYQSICKSHSVIGGIDQILCWSSFSHKAPKTVQIQIVQYKILEFLKIVQILKAKISLF